MSYYVNLTDVPALTTNASEISFNATSTQTSLNIFSLFAKVQNPFSNTWRSKNTLKVRKLVFLSSCRNVVAVEEKQKQKKRGEGVETEQRVKEMSEKPPHWSPSTPGERSSEPTDIPNTVTAAHPDRGSQNHVCALYEREKLLKL